MSSSVLIIFILIFIFVLFKPSNGGGKSHSKCSAGNSYRSAPVEHRGASCTPGARRADPEAMVNYSEHMSNSPGSDDYNQFIINTGIEKSVTDSHSLFAKEINTNTSGASAQSVMSHDDSIVPKWGLRRSTPHVPVSSTAREVPSSTDEQLAENSSPNKYGLF